MQRKPKADRWATKSRNLEREDACQKAIYPLISTEKSQKPRKGRTRRRLFLEDPPHHQLCKSH
jgi:hypothetical protein